LGMLLIKSHTSDVKWAEHRPINKYNLYGRVTLPGFVFK
jgi:hypothetical protein